MTVEIHNTLDDFKMHEIREAWAGKVYAFVPVNASNASGESLWALGVAVANERGYSPLPVGWCCVEMGPGAHEAISDTCDKLNADELGLSDDAAFRIVGSSMGARAPSRRVCGTCSSENVWVDANAAWNPKTQQYELLNTFDHAYCDDCDASTHIINPDEE